MKCPYCGAELPEDAELCPVCGKNLTDGPEAEKPETEADQPSEDLEPVNPIEAAAAEAAQASSEAASGAAPAEDPNAWKTCGKDTACDDCEEKDTCVLLQEHTAREADRALAEEQAAKKARRGKTWKLIGLIAGACVVLCAAVFFLYKSIKGPTIAHTNDAGYLSYTMTSDQGTKRVLDRVVATCGDEKLTNRQLTYYYWQQYYSFANNYGSYLSYMLDTSKGLDEQKYDDTNTWQQKFLENAVTMFQDISALNQEAAKNSFTLDQDTEDYLNTISSNLDQMASQYGYASGEAYLQEAFGSFATMDDYLSYARFNLTASSYLKTLVDAKSYTADDVSAYYDENKDNYTSQGVEKDDTPMVDVRHILIVPDEQNSDGTYTDAAWTAAEQKANDLLQQWLDGGGSEDSFAELAKSNSGDTGSASNGGLITGVYPGEMTSEFDNWCFADGRKVGDYGIVKTEYGYHIIYLSAVEDHAHWYEVAEADYQNKISMDIEDEVAAKYETTKNLENAAIVNVLAQANSTGTSEAEQAAGEATGSASSSAASSSAVSSSAASSAAASAASSSAGSTSSGN